MSVSWFRRSTALSRSICKGCCLVGVTLSVSGGWSLSVGSTLIGFSGRVPVDGVVVSAVAVFSGVESVLLLLA